MARTKRIGSARVRQSSCLRADQITPGWIDCALPLRAHFGRLREVGDRELRRVRKIALALPEVLERVSHGAPCFFVQNKRALCRYHDHHRGNDRISLWCPIDPDVQEALVGDQPDRFFKPTPSAAGVFADWIGVFLDTSEVDWTQVAAIVEQAFLRVAPKKLVAEFRKR